MNYQEERNVVIREDMPARAISNRVSLSSIRQVARRGGVEEGRTPWVIFRIGVVGEDTSQEAFSGFLCSSG